MSHAASDLATAAPVPLADLLPAIGIATDAVSFAPGETLFRSGQPSNGLYLIDSGEAALSGRAPGDRMVDLGRVGPGGVIGEFSLLDPGPRSASAVALTPLAARRVGLARFEALGVSGNPAALAIMDRLRLEVARRTRATLADIAATLAAGGGAVRPLGAGRSIDADPPVDLAALLHRFPGFDQFDTPDWQEFAAIARPVTAPRGAVIASAGQDGDALVIVARGAVRAGLPIAGGIEQLLLHGPGAFAGPTALMDSGPRPLTLEAREDAVLALIPAEPFVRLRRGETRLGRILMRQLGLQMVRDMRRLSRVLGRLRADTDQRALR